MGAGFLSVEVFTGNGDLPLDRADIEISDINGEVLYRLVSNENGQTESVSLSAPPAENSLNPDLQSADYYTKYNVRVSHTGFRAADIRGVQIFDAQPSNLPVILYPLPRGAAQADALVYDVGQIAAEEHEVRNQESDDVAARILREVVIPETIVVHLGPPASHARNVRVPFIDYIKNVASSEIFPDWPQASLEANIMAQITFALNRVYTEWYPVRGYDFNITNSTRTDQSFVEGRNIFQSISAIVDRVFNKYVRRQGFKEPYFTEYCSGRGVTCPGMSQWGTVDLAQRGFSPLDILKHYYPKDIEIVESDRFSGNLESYPGYSLSLGSVGEPVLTMQLFLNRISSDFPAIRPIQNPNGVFGTDTQQAVRTFQQTFGLTADGVIGRATWNYISRIYGAVKRLSELDSEGERLGIGATPPSVTIRQGSKGEHVVQLQHILNVIAAYYSSVPPVLETGIFDGRTTNSVIDFQRQFGLTADGIVGSGTWRKLYEVYRGIGDNSPGTNPPTGIEEYPGTPLRRGSAGEKVRLIQSYMNSLAQVFPSIPIVNVDGSFGPATEAQVMAFQRLFGLTVDGVVGPSTWRHIMEQHSLLDADAYPGVALRVGSRGNDVLRVQQHLNSIATRYPSIPTVAADGVFGNLTATSVREFQRHFGLTTDGVVGKQTWDAIMKEYRNPTYPRTQFTRTLREGDRGDQVRLMQNYLVALSNSYPSIPKITADGAFGPATAQAVRAFQELYGLQADGVIGPDTWQAISDAYWNLTGRSAMIATMSKMIVGKMFLG